MKKIAIIGGGVSGLTCARMLRDRFHVTVFEREEVVGGLIRCKRVNGSLFHICGGHVFNTRNQEVRDWFWSVFNKDRDFIKTDRHSAVCMEDGTFVDYPIENHVYQLDQTIQRGFIEDLKAMIRHSPEGATNFKDFLLSRFGKTLYDLYFEPYNAKIWGRDLSLVPLSWLAGKLPMPTVDEMILANMNHLEEKSFVHSSFYYEKSGGSQFLADELARGTDVRCSTEVRSIQKKDDSWLVAGEAFDAIVFCGNLKDLPMILRECDLRGYDSEIRALESHGTTAVFCETDAIPYSWFYQPSIKHRSHRFICTGNFAPSNNAQGKMTCTVEFTDKICREEIERELVMMPYHPKYITHHYSQYTYPIQHQKTRDMIQSLKSELGRSDLYLCGRFAEWEYFNMDAAMASAMSLSKTL